MTIARFSTVHVASPKGSHVPFQFNYQQVRMRRGCEDVLTTGAVVWPDCGSSYRQLAARLQLAVLELLELVYALASPCAVSSQACKGHQPEPVRNKSSKSRSCYKQLPKEVSYQKIFHTTYDGISAG